MKKTEEIKVPIRVKICSEIQSMLEKAAKRDQGIFVDKLVSAYIMKEGWTRRFILECINAVAYSGFAKFSFNEKKEKIIKKK